MPKTRDELCRQALDEFMTNEYGVRYHIRTLTTNLAASLHRYEIVIPKLFKLYDIDTHHTINGVVQDPGPVYQEQDLPMQHELAAHFNNYFSDFILYKESTSMIDDDTPAKIMSYVEITHTVTDSDNLILSVDVKYCNGHRPYPVVQHEINHFETKYNRLKQIYCKQRSDILLLEGDIMLYRRRLRIVKQRYDAFKTETHANHIANKNKFAALQKIIKQLYGQTNSTTECPVCYDAICVDKLTVPECGHFICSTCSLKCERCPICRDEPTNMTNFELAG
jgi:hypothetical protein